jgi:beta-glucosidase
MLWTAHGGQAAGVALARVLAGDVSPAGRLPQTWYADDADLPGLLDYDVIGSRQTYLYFEGTPLFPFGHGLSYASFAYDGLSAEVGEKSLRVSCAVANTGDLAADEVVQLYGRAVEPEVVRPRRELLAHRRVPLAPGERAEVEFEVPLRDLGFWDVARGAWRVAPGAYELLVGASSEDVRLREVVDLPGEPGAPRAVRATVLAAADFDEHSGAVIVDRAKAAGDAVTAADGGRAELLYRACDFGEGVTSVTVTVAGGGALELSTASGGEAVVTAALTPTAPTAGPYDHTTLTAPFPASGVRDLRIVLRGELRFAEARFEG